MMKFATYENIVEMTYKHLIPTPKDECSKPLQLGVSFGSGYVAGVFCAAVSHPADNLVSFLNNSKGATVGDVSPQSRLHFAEHCSFFLYKYVCNQ
jgi:solute carrier family 25 phosphate transporter 3